jgi:hypothetical protein
MLEAAQVLGGFSALLLIASLVLWTKRPRGPLLQRIDGGRAPIPGAAELASKMLVLAFGLSAVAALLALAEVIFA